MIGLDMRKLTALASAISSGVGYFLWSATTFAAEITIERPKVNNTNVGYDNPSEFVKNIITFAFIIATIAVLFMLVWGALEWILSGGDKEKVASAQKRITHALVGFAILAVAFAIATLAGQFLGFNIIGTFTVPGPTL